MSGTGTMDGWVVVPRATAEQHPSYGLDDGASMVVLCLLFGPLLLMADFFGIVVPAVRTGVEGAEALWAWQTPYLMVAGLGWVLLALLANHRALVIRALPLWVGLVLALTVGFCLNAGLQIAAFIWDVAIAASVGAAACLYTAYATRMRITLRCRLSQSELARLPAAGPPQ